MINQAIGQRRFMSQPYSAVSKSGSQFGSRNLHYVQWRLRKLPPPAVSVVNLAGERKFLMVTSYRQ